MLGLLIQVLEHNVFFEFCPGRLPLLANVARMIPDVVVNSRHMLAYVCFRKQFSTEVAGNAGGLFARGHLNLVSHATEVEI